MAGSYIHDQKRVIACASFLTGQYGHEGLYMGVPSVIGKDGVEKIIEIELTDEEKKLLDASAAHVRELVEAAQKL
jgi:malate dehydrogenase